MMRSRWVLREGKVFEPAPFCLAGIVNVTPDSFSDGGQYATAKDAVAHGEKLVADGAGMLDIGAESTRPCATPVSESEELRRLLPVLRELRKTCPDTPISIDTFKSGTAKAALEVGADVINDVSGCTIDPALREVLVSCKPGYVLMHSQGTPETMQIAPRYHQVVEEIEAFFETRMTELVRAGLPEERIVLDPGIGFGKNREHTMQLLQGLERFFGLGRPLYVGLSRKSMFQKFLGLDVRDRDEATHLAVALLAARGVIYHRVHDVAGCARALRLVEAISPDRSVC